MPAELIGAHMPTSGGLDKALANGRAIGCTAVQVFTSNPRQWKGKEITAELAEAFQSAAKEGDLPGEALISHDTYLINLAAPDEELREKSKAAILSELTRCAALGITGAVSHMGAHKDQGEEKGLERVAESVREIEGDMPESVTLLMETTAGQGSSLNYQIEHLGKILDLTNGSPRLGVCLDTCHLFAAGYDLSTEEGYEECMAKLESEVGFDRIKACHVNDSKHPCGSRKDRHEHLGEGEIGPSAFQRLVNDDRFRRIPLLIETPKADEMHEENVRRLWDWIDA